MPAGIDAALRRAQDYLLDRGMFRSLRTGEQINAEWSLFAYPYSWHYDVLRGLDHLRVAGVAPDERAADAIALVESRRSDDGTWPRDAVSSERVRYAMEEVGAPSRWNTLRALRVTRLVPRLADAAGDQRTAVVDLGRPRHRSRRRPRAPRARARSAPARRCRA